MLEDMILHRALEWRDLLAICRHGYHEAADSKDRHWMKVWHDRSTSLIKSVPPEIRVHKS